MSADELGRVLAELERINGQLSEILDRLERLAP